MTDTLIKVEGVSKKFCRGLKRSLWYGLQDLGNELRGHRHGGNGHLRPEEFWAIRDISFSLQRGETLGLIGANGAGKTTLLRVLNGLIKPDSGRIEIRGRMQALIALGAGFNPILTGRENIIINASILGFTKADIERRFDDIIEFSGVSEFIDAPVQSYSSGMAVRLGFAVASHLDPDILLVDEVLAVGDEGFQARCLKKVGALRETGTAIVLVSHNMHTISTFSSRILLMRPGGWQIFDQVPAGVMAYKRLFTSNDDMAVEKVCTGTADFHVFDVEVSPQHLTPGGEFFLTIHYRATREFPDVEADITIFSNNETGIHFQATNRAYGQSIRFQTGGGTLKLRVEGLRINNAGAKIGIAVWSQARHDLLFWWRIPVQFEGKLHTTGNVFYDASFVTSVGGLAAVEGPKQSLS